MIFYFRRLFLGIICFFGSEAVLLFRVLVRLDFVFLVGGGGFVRMKLSFGCMVFLVVCFIV